MTSHRITQEQSNDLTMIASQYLSENPKYKNKGYVIIFKNKVSGWINEIRDPQHWEPDCYAISSELNRAYFSIGGNPYDGAKKWVSVVATKEATKNDESNICNEQSKTNVLFSEEINQDDKEKIGCFNFSEYEKEQGENLSKTQLQNAFVGLKSALSHPNTLLEHIEIKGVQ